MNKESLKHEISGFMGDFLLENVHRSVYGVKNLNTAKNHVENGGSILFYFNHFSKLDPILYGGIINDYVTPLANTASVLSFRHMDPERGLLSKLQATLFSEWEKKYGITAISVIQKKDMQGYLNANEFNSRAAREAAKFLRKPGHVLGIAPEGTRSKINELLQAEEGFETLFKLGGKNVLALPAAGVHSTIRPYNTQTKVSIGAPFSYEEISRESKEKVISVTDLAMQKIASLLPEQNRGYYR
jgi:1-acyl-sn-glycerol-3-phosphate acyltransferase